MFNSCHIDNLLSISVNVIMLSFFFLFLHNNFWLCTICHSFWWFNIFSHSSKFSTVIVVISTISIIPIIVAIVTFPITPDVVFCWILCHCCLFYSLYIYHFSIIDFAIITIFNIPCYCPFLSPSCFLQLNLKSLLIFLLNIFAIFVTSLYAFHFCFCWNCSIIGILCSLLHPKTLQPDSNALPWYTHIITC